MIKCLKCPREIDSRRGRGYTLDSGTDYEKVVCFVCYQREVSKKQWA